MGNFERIQQELSAKAAHIDATYRADKKAVIADRHLSQEGKQARLKVMEVTRTSQVAALQEDAKRQLDAARSAHKIAIRKARAAAAEKQRAVLGDQLYLQMLERRVRSASAVDAVAMLEQAASEWEATVLEILVGEKIQEQLDAGERSTDLYSAGPRFDAVRSKNQELIDLERQEYRLGAAADEWLKTMDGVAFRENFAARLGVDPEYVQLPGAQA